MSAVTPLDRIILRSLRATVGWLNERFAGRFRVPAPANDNGFSGRAG